MKTLKKSFVALALAMCLILSLVSCELPLPTQSSSSSGADPVNASYAYIAIDINPSIELVVADGIIESVRACNDDAEVLLSGEDITGLSAEEATEKIVALAEELGYITDENTDVSITVTADDETSGAELEARAKDGAKKGSSRIVVNSNPRVADTREVKELKDKNPELYKNLSPAQLRIIKSIMELDPEMTIEVAMEMETDELIKLLKSYTEEFKDFNGKELRDKAHERKKELIAQREAEIAEAYGEDYLALWTKINALKTIYKGLEAKAEGIEISPEELEALNEIVAELSTYAGKEFSSVEHADDFEDILDRIKEYFQACDGTSEELEALIDELEALVESLEDKYDEDAYALTDEELASIVAIYGECEITTLGELEALIDALEDELKALRESITLDDIQRATIDDAKERFDVAKEQVKNELKDEMDQAREHFESQKNDRREAHGNHR